MKKVIALVILVLISSLTATFSHASSQGKSCSIPGDEALVCEVIMCAVGINIPASAAQCVKVNLKFAKYLATLGFWSKPPSCKTKDKNCDDVGSQDAPLNANVCDALGSVEEQESCKAATGEVTPEYCDTLSGSNQLACKDLIEN
jgi:hypothetical protein